MDLLDGPDPLDGLDDEQRAAAQALDGPVAILAGAGTGKTRAITHRIAHGVHTGRHDPRRTLAVTFTTRAAGEMRTRLHHLGVEGVAVRTFHAAALRQLRYFWPRLSGGEFPELMASKARLVAEAAHRVGAATDTATVRDVSSDLEWAKALMLATDAVAAESERRHRTLALPAEQFTRLQVAYEELKSERGLMDFEDVLLVTVGALSARPDIADEVRAAYRWFTVDEYQDVNPLQHRLLSLWLGDRDDIAVVGDASQTIYSFTGATPQYLTGFLGTYPQATQVQLVRCYRCTPQVVGLANAVIAAGERASTHASAAARPLMLRSMRSEGPAPQVIACDDDVAEAEQAASRVRAWIDAGTAPRDIAVLFRINAQSAALEDAFAAVGIPVVLRGTERYFDRPEVREAVTRLRGAARGGDASMLQAGLGDTVRAVLGAAGWSPTPPSSAGAVRERWESLAALAALADERAAELGDSLTDFVAELDVRTELQHAPVADGVTLASIHSAKGLEWSRVIVVGVSEGLLPLQYADTADLVEEERRLLYVAITRAADELVLSWARARQPGGRASREPSRFLRGTGAVPADDEAQVRRGSGRARGEKRRTGPARCRICRTALVTGEERALGRCATCPSDIDEELLDALRAWRLEQSREAQVPAYVVFTDRTLMAVAEQRPSDDDGLAAIPGIGPAKLERYGAALLALIAQRSAD